jgi:tetratricopeptide (TPR) repeat protein
MQPKKDKKPAPQFVPKVTLAPSLFGISFKVKAIVLISIAFLLYINTVANKFALDDGIVIVQNEYVQEGFKGMGKILSTDAYDSYYRQMHANQMLAGGRYRPLSIVVFAIEHQLFGESWSVRHFISVLFYMLCVFTIFLFLSKYLFKKLQSGEDMAFVATLLFIIHPMHTEVVANVKSLDEILSLICIMCTFIFALKYIDTKKTKDLCLGMLFYLLALLAKEYAVMLVISLPLLFYLLTNKKPLEALISSVPYYGVLVVYMLMRIGSVGIPRNVPSTEILNNPYMLATHAQKIATEIFVLGKYLYMLFFPYPLSSDYSYATIPYQNFTSPGVLLTVVVYLGILAWGIKLVLKRNMLAFPIVFYLLNLAMVSNFLIDIGATMGERLAFHSSLGFVIIISYGLFYFVQKMPFQAKKNTLTGVMVLLVALCAAEDIPRNAEWQSDVTLFIHDVDIVPNSVMVNGNAGARYIDLAEKSQDSVKYNAYLRKGIQYLMKSISLHKTYVNSYLNLGVAYYKLFEPDSAKLYWDIAKKLYPDHPNLQQYYPLLAQDYMMKGSRVAKGKNLQEGIDIMRKGIIYDPNNADIWYNLGGAYYTAGNYDSARAAWTRTLKLRPGYPDAVRGMNALPPQKNK